MRLGLRGRMLLLILVALTPPTAIALIVALVERHEARVHAPRAGRRLPGTSGWSAARSPRPPRRTLASTTFGTSAAGNGPGSPSGGGDDGGCGCRVAGQNGPTRSAGYLLFGLVLLGLERRRAARKRELARQRSYGHTAVSSLP